MAGHLPHHTTSRPARHADVALLCEALAGLIACLDGGDGWADTAIAVQRGRQALAATSHDRATGAEA